MGSLKIKGEKGYLEGSKSSLFCPGVEWRRKEAFISEICIDNFSAPSRLFSKNVEIAGIKDKILFSR